MYLVENFPDSEHQTRNYEKTIDLFEVVRGEVMLSFRYGGSMHSLEVIKEKLLCLHRMSFERALRNCGIFHYVMLKRSLLYIEEAD